MSSNLVPPHGFHPLVLPGGYFEEFGPLYARLDEAVPVLGFRAGRQHMNPLGDCHGGVISAFADMQALGAQQVAGINDRYTPTVSLSVDYVAPTKLGAWVQMRVELLCATRSLLFSQATITADSRLIARSSAVYAIGQSPRYRREFLEPLFR